MSCDDARAALLAGDIESAASHIAGCRSCRADEKSWQRWREMLMEPSIWEEPSDHLAARIFERVENATRGSRSSRLRLLWAGAAAVLVVLVGALVFANERSPDWSIPLVAIVADPGTSALVNGWNTSTGTRIELHVAGITPAPDGHYYEIWMTAPDGRHVSAGSFRGEGTVSAWAAVKRSEFPRIWITLEKMDDNLGPSPTTYFDMVG
jgi:anti-sigma-K factor RskA